MQGLLFYTTLNRNPLLAVFLAVFVMGVTNDEVFGFWTRKKANHGAPHTLHAGIPQASHTHSNVLDNGQKKGTIYSFVSALEAWSTRYSIFSSLVDANWIVPSHFLPDLFSPLSTEIEHPILKDSDWCATVSKVSVEGNSVRFTLNQWISCGRQYKGKYKRMSAPSSGSSSKNSMFLLMVRDLSKHISEDENDSKNSATKKLKNDATEKLENDATEELKNDATEELKNDATEELKNDATEELKNDATEELMNAATEELMDAIKQEIKGNVYSNYMFWIDRTLNALFLRYKVEKSGETINHLITQMMPKIETPSTGDVFEVANNCMFTFYQLSVHEINLCRYLVRFQTQLQGASVNYREKEVLEVINHLLNIAYRSAEYSKLKLFLSQPTHRIIQTQLEKNSETVYLITLIFLNDKLKLLRTKLQVGYNGHLPNIKKALVYRVWMETRVVVTYENKKGSHHSKDSELPLIKFIPISNVFTELEIFNQLLDQRKNPVLSTLWAIQTQFVDRDTLPIIVKRRKMLQDRKKQPAPYILAFVTDIELTAGRLSFKTLPCYTGYQLEERNQEYKLERVDSDTLKQAYRLIQLDIVGVSEGTSTIEKLTQLEKSIKFVKSVLPSSLPSEHITCFFWLDKFINRLYFRYPSVSSMKLQWKDYLIADVSSTVKRWYKTKKTKLFTNYDEWVTEHLKQKCVPCETNERATTEVENIGYIFSKRLIAQNKRTNMWEFNHVKQWKEQKLDDLLTTVAKYRCKAPLKALKLLPAVNQASDITVYMETIKSSIILTNKYRINFCSVHKDSLVCAFCEFSSYKKPSWKRLCKNGIQRLSLVSYKVRSDNCSAKDERYRFQLKKVS